VSIHLARAGLLARQTISGGSFDPDTVFDLGYGIGTDLGSVDSTITSWGHTLTLVADGGTGLTGPTVKTDTGKKVARFVAATPDHIGLAVGPASMPFDVWILSKHANPIAGHVSRWFSPNPGSTVVAQVAADADFPADWYMNAGGDYVGDNGSEPGAWHVWRFMFEGSTAAIELDGSEVASGSFGGSGTLSGFHLGCDYFGTSASDYDVAAWGLASSILDSGDAGDALTYLNTFKP
jgi:hypothetical protein